MRIPLRTGNCSHQECKYHGPLVKKLCPMHYRMERAAARKPKLPKKKYRQWNCTKQRIKVKDWKNNPQKLLDNIVSKFILKKYGPRCYTCEEELAQENGHFAGRSNHATRWLEDNCRPQGKMCNQDKHGNLHVFRERLIKELGLARVEELERLAKTSVKFAPFEIREMTEMFEEKLMMLELDKASNNEQQNKP